MAEYDASKDLIIWEAPTSQDGLMVKVVSYNGYAPKIRCQKVSTYNNQQQVRPCSAFTVADFVHIGQYWSMIEQAMNSARQQ